MYNSKTDTHRIEARIKLCSDITKKTYDKSIEQIEYNVGGFF